jgi:diphthamide synthase (EF-2-diphthine--ammonia ligase)
VRRNAARAAFAGREYDKALLRDLPSGVDPCGENGEFHSFVYDGPTFQRPVSVRIGKTVVRDGRYYADLLRGKDKPTAAMQAAN